MSILIKAFKKIVHNMIAQNIKKQIVKETRLFDVIIYLCEIIFVKLYLRNINVFKI
jgi:hypothetical protein